MVSCVIMIDYHTYDHPQTHVRVQTITLNIILGADEESRDTCSLSFVLSYTFLLSPAVGSLQNSLIQFCTFFSSIKLFE